MSRCCLIVAGLLATFFSLGATAASGAEPSWPWSPYPLFEAGLRLPPPPASAYEAAYSLYDSSGKEIVEMERPLIRRAEPVEVPPVPGVYRLEAWYQNQQGERGPAVTSTLRFDDVAPPSPQLQAPGGWVMGADPVELKIAAAEGPLPLSGIAGYAAAIDRSGGSSPCASSFRCTPGELDLSGEDGALSLGTLPEGIDLIRAVAVSGSGLASAAAIAEVRVDASLPTLALRGVPESWSRAPVRLTAQAADELSGMAPAGPLGPFTAITVDGAPAARTAGDVASATVGGSGAHQVRYFARDAAGNVADGADGAPEPQTATVRIDEDPPSVLFAAAQDPAEPERIEAFVRDGLAGPSGERGWIGVRPAGSRARFEQLPTQTSAGRLVTRWDSDSYPPGKYEFLATGFDLAGNSATGDGRSRGGRMLLVNPLKTKTSLETRLDHHGLRLTGRLHTVAGPPAAGQEIAIVEELAAGSKPSRRTTSVRTDADGGFSVRLGAGPSRTVFAIFAGTRTLTRASSEKAELKLRATIRFRASAATARVGGPPVVFSGRVKSLGSASAARLPIELQFRYRGSRWSEFRTVEADARGRFRYAYRFSDDDSRGVRFQFRAYVKGREGWPYEPGSSRPVSVTGR